MYQDFRNTEFMTSLKATDLVSVKIPQYADLTLDLSMVLWSCLYRQSYRIYCGGEYNHWEKKPSILQEVDLELKSFTECNWYFQI